MTAAAIVAQDTFAFPDCRGADQFRNGQFNPLLEERLLDDIFNRQEAARTPTPSNTPTRTRTPSATRTPTRSPTQTQTPSETPTVTAPPTNTRLPSPTHTETGTPTRTATRTPTVTPTPTGLAQQLAGDWVANWRNETSSCCFLEGQPPPPLCVADAAYRVTAAPNNQLRIVNLASGQVLGTAAIQGSGTVQPPTVVESTGTTCFGVPVVVTFDYTFSFSTSGVGTAEVLWTYGANTNCQVCDKRDAATLQRVARN